MPPAFGRNPKTPKYSARRALLIPPVEVNRESSFGGNFNSDGGINRQRIEAAALAELTEEEIRKMTPRDMFKIIAMEALRNRNMPAILQIAKEWAPYEHPKLVATTLESKEKRTVYEYSDEELFALASASMGDEGDFETAEVSGESNAVHEIYDAELPGSET